MVQPMSDDAAQADYYEQTATTYDEAHLAPGDEHFIALEYIAGLCTTVQAATVLDVGAGTGRALRHLAKRLPETRLTGLEPVRGLRAVAEAHGGGEFVEGVGEELPFEDDQFDVVIATAVMHHVPDPARIIAEMTRVARRAVMISDANRFGGHSKVPGLLKLGLRATGLWKPYMHRKTGGTGHLYSEGDGLFYSYSLYDSIPQLTAWADRTFLVPTKGQPTGRWTGPLLTAQQALLVGVREPCFEGWAGLGSPARA